MNGFVIPSESQMTQDVYFAQGNCLLVNPMENDLGIAYEFDIVKGFVELTNTTEELITLKNTHSSCGCSIALLEQREIPPGQTLTLYYTIDTSRKSDVLTAHFDILFDVGRQVVDQHVAFRSTAHIITKGKVIANPAFIKRDDVLFQTRFNEKIVLCTSGKEPLPNIIIILHPEWLNVNYSKEKNHEAILELEGQIPNVSGQLDEKIVVVLDNEWYSRLEIPLFFQVKGLISFENMPIVRIAKESDIPMHIDVLVSFSDKGKIESVFLDSDDIMEKSVDFEYIDDWSVMSGVSFSVIERKSEFQTVFRSTLTINAIIGDNLHTAKLPIVLIMPK